MGLRVAFAVKRLGSGDVGRFPYILVSNHVVVDYPQNEVNDRRER